MSRGAGGFTVVRAPDVAARSREVARTGGSSDASIVAWELAARARYDAALAEAREALASLAFDVAEGIIGRAVTVDGGVLHAMTSQAIERARGARRLLVRVHPDDVAGARRSAAEALSDDARVEWIEVAADPGLARGCAAVETERGVVTADWAGSLSLARERWRRGAGPR